LYRDAYSSQADGRDCRPEPLMVRLDTPAAMKIGAADDDRDVLEVFAAALDP
jgi:hypothetical protein